MTTIRPRRVHWPSLFWWRAESCFADNDLLCRTCEGRGCRLSREDINGDTVPADVACPACRGSGLLVPARDVPDDIEGMFGAEEAGGSWLDWIGHEGDGLLWPAPWAWRISGQQFGILNDVYLGGPDLLAFMSNRDVLIGLYELDRSSRGRLEMVFRLACGETEVPAFVLPKSSRW